MACAGAGEAHVNTPPPSLAKAPTVAAVNATVEEGACTTGATGALTVDAAPVPTAFDAATVSEYNAIDTGNVDAGNVNDDAPEPAAEVTAILPDAGTYWPGTLLSGTTCRVVITYPVTTEPPSSAGADHDTGTAPVPSGCADTPTGTSGTRATDGVPTPAPAAETPTPFTAVNDTSYAVPFDKPPTIADTAPAAAVTWTALPPAEGVADSR